MEYQVAIIGAGPSGITTSIYLKRAGINFVLFENELIGGKVNLTADIDNYPPFKHISGFDLALDYEKVLKANDIKVTREKVLSLKKENEFIIQTNKNIYQVEAVLVCSGTKNKYLNLPSEKKFISKGISTCAVCDGNLFKNEIMTIVGGGNSALEEAIYLSNIASKVYLIHRRNEFRGSKQYLDELIKKENVEILTPYIIKEFLGENHLSSLIIENVETKQEKTIETKVLFEYVGLIPNTSFIEDKSILDEKGFVIVDKNMHTSIEGLFASGDVTNKSLRQIIVASGDGALASQEILNYLLLKK